MADRGGLRRPLVGPFLAVALGLAVVLVASLRSGDAGSTLADASVTPPTASGHDVVQSSLSPASPVSSVEPTPSNPSSSVRPTLAASTSTTDPVAVEPTVTYHEVDVDPDDPALGNRDLPESSDAPPPTTIAPPPWAASTSVTAGGHVSTDVGCATGTSPHEIDRFLADRVGPVLGWDYQHVYPLGGGRYLWLFQDAFIDHTGAATTLPSSDFVHNAALVQDQTCFTLLHRGTADSPRPFEIGDGRSSTRATWWWPMGGERSDDRLWVFWVEMVKDPYDPDPPLGLGWHPVRTYLASYDTTTLVRKSFELAPNSGVAPIYGYAASSDDTHTYLFGNTFEQNMVREGGFWDRPHSATSMWLARVPRGRLAAPPEYRTTDGWSSSAADAVSIVDRYFVENPMQPRYLAGQWVSATAVDGYWGDQLAIDVADRPWGPWYTISLGPLLPRGGDPLMNTYHAHLLPVGGGEAGLTISVSNNARNMRRDAWSSPQRYRPTVFWQPTAPTPTTTTSTTTTSSTTPSTTTTTSTSTTTSTLPAVNVTSTTSTSLPPTNSSTTTTSAPTTTSTTSSSPSSTTTTSTSTTTSTPTTTTTSVVVATTTGLAAPADG